MQTKPKITAVIGTYRKDGIIDTAVDEILAAAREEGAETRKIYLTDTRIEFCTNCRSCMQMEGTQRGQCPLADDMGAVLDQLERVDALVLASPTNFGTVTAVMKRFIERLACYACWPWGKPAPRMRRKGLRKPMLLVVSAAAPAPLARLCTPIVGLLKKAAAAMGGRTVGVLFIGLAAQRPKQDLSPRMVAKARRLGSQLVAAARK